MEGFITGLHKSPYHGFSVEFAEHRLYNNGESTKHIDWKLYAKTDKLFIKKYEEETNLRCHFLIDASSMLFPNNEPYNKLSFSIDATAALIYLMRVSEMLLGYPYLVTKWIFMLLQNLHCLTKGIFLVILKNHYKKNTLQIKKKRPFQKC